MVSVVREIKKFPFESVGWFLGGAGLAGIAVWVHHKFFGGSQSLEKWETELQKELGFDRLKINKTLSFGTQTRKCPNHVDGQSLCTDRSCYFGPLGHLVEAISMANKSVDVAIFSFRSSVIGEAIMEAHERGAQVRVVSDGESAFDEHCPLQVFRKAGILVRQRISPYHMHHKFVVLDGEIVITGSMNFSDTGTNGNWENVIITSEPAIVVPFVNEFQALWEDFAQGRELKFEEIPKHARAVKNHRVL